MNSIFLALMAGGLVTACNISATPNMDAPDKVSVISDSCKLIDEYLNRLASEKNFSGALLILRGDNRIFSKGYGWANLEKKIPFTSGTLASIGSITKAFTAAAIMKLVEQNKLTLDDRLAKFFNGVPATKADITIHQLLTHSSGFHEFLSVDGGDYEKIETDAFLERAFKEPLSFEPGTKAVYTNVGYSILGIIIERVSGIDYEEFLEKHLFKPVGIQSIGYHYPADRPDRIAVGYQNRERWGTHQERYAKAGGGPYWNLKANGGLEASLDDMYLWLKSFLDYTVLTQESIEMIFTAHIEEDGYGGASWFGYGCSISKSRRNTKLISNGGSNGIYFARIARLPEENIIFYLVTNESTINANKVLPNISQLLFDGRIEQDVLTMQQKFSNTISEKIYSIVTRTATNDLGSELLKEEIKVDDDMILLEVGQKLIEEGNNDKALVLYTYYTRTFPKIVVAWNDLGDVYLLQGDENAARKCYEQALLLRPENQRARESISKLSR